MLWKLLLRVVVSVLVGIIVLLKFVLRVALARFRFG
jgi:hypothetical protein